MDDDSKQSEVEIDSATVVVTPGNINQFNKDQRANSYLQSLFIQTQMAETFSCIICGRVPRNCMNTDDGLLLCDIPCAESYNKATSNARGVQKMINNMKIKCINNSDLPDISHTFLDEGPICNTGSDLNINCEWEGKLKDWEMHNKQECEYAIIDCKLCPNHSCIRKSMIFHMNNDCTHMIVECPLKCRQSLKRCELETHAEKDCTQFLLPCENIGCGLQIKRQWIHTHMNSECDHRLIFCSYSKYGCNTNGNSNGIFPFCELKQHMIDCTMEHLNLKLEFVMNQNADLIAMQKLHTKQIQKMEKDFQTLSELVLDLRVKSFRRWKSEPIFSLKEEQKNVPKLKNTEKESDFKWKYNGRNRKVFKISDNGLKITVFKRNGCGSIMFGDWFSNESISCFTVHIRVSDKFISGNIGFGFCTSEFNDWIKHDYNYGGNHSTNLYCNGYFVQSREFKHTYKHRTIILKLPFLEAGQTLAIQVDMVSNVGRIWNYTTQEVCADDNERVFKVQLPKNKKIGIICNSGQLAQSVEVVRQILVYDL